MRNEFFVIVVVAIDDVTEKALGRRERTKRIVEAESKLRWAKAASRFWSRILFALQRLL